MNNSRVLLYDAVFSYDDGATFSNYGDSRVNHSAASNGDVTFQGTVLANRSSGENFNTEIIINIVVNNYRLYLEVYVFHYDCCLLVSHRLER